MAKIRLWWLFAYYIFDWWGLTSGGLSVPFTFFGTFHVFSGYPKTTFLVLGYLTLLIAMASLVKRLYELITPRLRVGCNPEDSSIGGGNSDPHRAIRCHVISDSRQAVKECRAQLIRIEKDGNEVWGHNNAILCFAPSDAPDATRKTIHEKERVHLDIFFLHPNSVIVPGTKDRKWQFGQSLDSIFNVGGDYILTIQIVGDCPTVEARLKFAWTRDYFTSKLSLA